MTKEKTTSGEDIPSPLAGQIEMDSAHQLTFEEQCSLGQNADILYREKKYGKAQLGYFQLLRKIQLSEKMDIYILSKTTLGLLLVAIKTEHFEEATEMWTSQQGTLFGYGVYGLEQGQTSVHDLMLFYMISSFLFTKHSKSKPDEAARAVNQYLSHICQFALEQEPELLPMALNNWRLHLNDIYKEGIPQDQKENFEKFEELMIEYEKIDQVQFPDPDGWNLDWIPEEERAKKEFGIEDDEDEEFTGIAWHEFLQTMNAIEGLVEEEKFEEAMEMCIETQEVLAYWETPHPQQQVWTEYYEVKCLYGLNFHRDAFKIIEAMRDRELELPEKNQAWLYSVASEMSIRLEHPIESTMEWGHKSLEIRQNLGDPVDSFQVAYAMCRLLEELDRSDLNLGFSLALMDLGRDQGEGKLLILAVEYMLQNAEKTKEKELIDEIKMALGEIPDQEEEDLQLRLKEVKERWEKINQENG